MVVAKRRIPSSTTPTSTLVAAGSVWESRMKSDEVRGGIKVFNNGDDNSDEVAPNAAAAGIATRLMRSTVAANGKKRTWKSESGQKSCDEQCKDLTVSSDGIKKSPIPARKPRTEGAPILGRKLRSDVPKDAGESSEGAERSLRKSKSDSIRTANQNNVKSVVGENNSVQLRKTKSASDRVSDESSNGNNGGIENVTAQNEKEDDTDENCKDFGVCEEKLISSSTENVRVPKCSPELSVLVDGDADGLVDEDEDEDEEEDGADETIEIETEESFDVKEISIPAEPKIVKESENDKVVNEQDKKMVVKRPENNNSKVANELDKKVVAKKPEKKVVIDEPVNKKAVNVNQPEPKRIRSTYRRFQQNNERPASIPAVTVKQSPPVRRPCTIYQNVSKENDSHPSKFF